MLSSFSHLQEFSFFATFSTRIRKNTSKSENYTFKNEKVRAKAKNLLLKTKKYEQKRKLYL